MTLSLPALVFAAVIGTTQQTWEYDGLYRTTKATDNNDPTVTSDDSVVTCAYDSLSRRLEEHQILGGNDKIVSSDWQDDDLRKTLVYPNGRQVGTAWDSLERLKTVTNVASYQYIGPARLLERTYQNGTRLTLANDAGTLASGYDGDQRVVQLRHLGAANALLAGFAYTHDRMDNRLTEDRQHNALKDQWAYDSLYRVVDQKRDVPDAGGNPGEERAWTLDGPGNWTSLGITTPLATTTLTQGLNTLNSYTSFGGVAQADDLDGNRIDDGRFLYKWDFLHRLREVHCKTGGELVATYLCDAYGANGHLNGSGRRVRKIVTADKHGCSGTFEALKETDEMPGDTEDANDPGAEKAFAKRKASDIRYLYDGMACVEERDGTLDRVLRQYVNGSRVNEHLTMDLYKSDGVKLKGTLFYHEDAKGWIVALTDKTGKLKERMSYDAFGMPRFENAKGKASGNQTQSKFGNPYLYGGSYFDLETRLFLMGHRFYSPAEGRFISRDPIGIWGDRGSRGNPYVYIGVNGWDPEGLYGGIDWGYVWGVTWRTPMYMGISLGRGLAEPITASGDVLHEANFYRQHGRLPCPGEIMLISLSAEHAEEALKAGRSKAAVVLETGILATPLSGATYTYVRGVSENNQESAFSGGSMMIGQAALMFLPGAIRMAESETNVPVQGGAGAAVRGISPTAAHQIQAFSNKFNIEVNVVGSRAAGTAGLASDFDYVIGGTSSVRHSARFFLPRGFAGGELRGGMESGIDIFNANRTPLDPTRPFIRFTPEP